jgi:sec-independent protein translocase protein TatC
MAPMPEYEDDKFEEQSVTELSFVEHLEELRRRIIYVIIFFLAAFCVSFFFAPHIVSILIAPLKVATSSDQATLSLSVRPDGVVVIDNAESTSSPLNQPKTTTHPIVPSFVQLRNGANVFLIPSGGKSNQNLFFLSPVEPFFLLVKASLLLALPLTAIVAIHQLWLFIAPGLLPRERRIVKPILLASLILFPLGASFAYAVSHVMLRILLSFSEAIPGLQANIVASSYLSFILTLMLGFGLVFEFPLLLILLSRLGLIDSAFLIQRRKYAILVIAVLAAVLTPSPDALNMILMMLPLIVLYELSIWAIRIIEKASGTPSSLGRLSWGSEKESD